MSIVNRILEAMSALFLGYVVVAGAMAVITAVDNAYMKFGVLTLIAYLIGKGTVIIEDN